MRRSIRQGRLWWTRAGALAQRESGQTMAEYAVVLGVLIIAVAAAFTVFSSAVDQKLQSDITTILSGL